MIDFVLFIKLRRGDILSISIEIKPFTEKDFV